MSLLPRFFARPRTAALLCIIFVLVVFLLHSGPTGDELDQEYAPYRPTKPGPQHWDDWADDFEEDVPSPSKPGGGSGVGGWLKTGKLGLEGLGLTGSGKKKKTLLITGGAGQLGQALVNDLSSDYLVHVVDVQKRPVTLRKSSNIVYHRGSILEPSTLLSSLFTSVNFDGVIHLAAVSLETWCSPKEAECLKVNEGGTQAVLDHINSLRQRQKRAILGWGKVSSVPWIIYASSMDVYGSSEMVNPSVDEESDRNPTTAVGRTKLAGEKLIEAAGFSPSIAPVAVPIPDAEELEKRAPSSGGGQTPIRAAIVRFSDVYGFPQSTAITQQFFPALIIHSITSTAIQYSSDAHPMDLLHVDDAVEGMKKVMARLGSEQDSVVGGVATYNLVSGGKRWTQEEVVDLVRAQTGTMSPVRDMGDHKSSFAGVAEYSNAKASKELDWQPATSLAVGLGKAVTQLSSEMAEYTRSFLSDNCPPSPDFPSLDAEPHEQPEDVRNKDLTNLEGCTVGMGFNHDGWIHHVKCEDGRFCGADGDKVISYNWNASVWYVRVQPSSETRERMVRVRFEDEKGQGTLGISEENWDQGVVQLEMFPPDQEEDAAILDFDIEVQDGSSNLRVVVPRSGQQLHAVANSTDNSTFFVMEHMADSEHFDMRMTVICCPKEGDWPLLLDDFETADVLYGHTGQIPFNASRRMHQCSRAERAVGYNYARLSAEQRALDAMASPPELGESLQDALQVSRELSVRADDWGLKELPPCWNDCDSPTICIQTGDCRCVRADGCRSKRDNPLLTNLRTVTNPIKSLLEGNKLATVVAKKDWRDVLLPEARDSLVAQPDFPKVHVVTGYPGEAEIEAAECHKLHDRHCFSADNIMYRAMRHISVPAKDADLIVLPLYEQCTGQPFMMHDMVAYAMKTIPGVLIQEKKLAFVLTHDWGVCVSFAWEIWSARGEADLHPDWLLRNALVWSVQGDYNSPCYRPDQDIVVPARTCRSNDLLEHFGDLKKVPAMRERPKLLSWSGTYWGTGKNTRLRLTCERGGAGMRELVPGGGPQSSWYNWDYMGELKNARFCPQPTGIAGWSPRTNDAIYAGCIPVLTAEGSHYPFADFLDWSKFSIRIKPTELDEIERILAAIPLEQLEEMQANLMLVRDAFLYSSDESPEDELDRHGPLFFALHQANVRLRTKYPVGEKGVSADTIYRQPISEIKHPELLPT